MTKNTSFKMVQAINFQVLLLFLSFGEGGYMFLYFKLLNSMQLTKQLMETLCYNFIFMCHVQQKL